jgi:hypothetical protein
LRVSFKFLDQVHGRTFRFSFRRRLPNCHTNLSVLRQFPVWTNNVGYTTQGHERAQSEPPTGKIGRDGERATGGLLTPIVHDDAVRAREGAPGSGWVGPAGCAKGASADSACADSPLPLGPVGRGRPR